MGINQNIVPTPEEMTGPLRIRTKEEFEASRFGSTGYGGPKMGVGGISMTDTRRTPLNQNPIDILGVPNRAPGFQSMTGPGGKLKSQFEMTADPELAGAYAERLRGTGDIDRLRERATATGMSKEAQLQRQGLTQRAKQQAAGQRAGVWGNLAMRGGLSGGARERLAGKLGAQEMAGIQDIGLQTSLADEATKSQLAQALPGLNLAQESSILGAQQGDTARREAARSANILSQQANLYGQNQFNQERFRQQMEALAAERQARAEEAGKL